MKAKLKWIHFSFDPKSQGIWQVLHFFFLIYKNKHNFISSEDVELILSAQGIFLEAAFQNYLKHLVLSCI